MVTDGVRIFRPKLCLYKVVSVRRKKKASSAKKNYKSELKRVEITLYFAALGNVSDNKKGEGEEIRVCFTIHVAYANRVRVVSHGQT